eukprot:3754089-Amphidinium_carterae.1
MCLENQNSPPLLHAGAVVQYSCHMRLMRLHAACQQKCPKHHIFANYHLVAFWSMRVQEKNRWVQQNMLCFNSMLAAQQTGRVQKSGPLFFRVGVVMKGRETILQMYISLDCHSFSRTSTGGLSTSEALSSARNCVESS